MPHVRRPRGSGVAGAGTQPAAPTRGRQEGPRVWWRLPRRRTAAGAETGQALVELSIALPVLLILLLGVMEFGFMFSSYLGLLHGARRDNWIGPGRAVDRPAGAHDPSPGRHGVRFRVQQRLGPAARGPRGRAGGGAGSRRRGDRAADRSRRGPAQLLAVDDPDPAGAGPAQGGLHRDRDPQLPL